MATRTLEVRLTGDSVVLTQAMDKAEKKAAKTEAELDRLRKRLDEVKTSTDRTGKSQADFAQKNDVLGDRLRATTSHLGSFDHKIAAVKWPALIAGAGYAAEGVGTLTAGVVGLGGALAPLSGTLAAYPALFGAMGQSAGVVAVAQVDELSGALEGNKEALKKLTPAARAFVGELEEMEPAYKRLQGTVQQDLFAGVGKGLDSAKGNFGVLETVLDGTATALGGIAEKAGELAGSKGFGRDLESIGGSNTKIIERLGGASIALGDSLRHVMVAAEPLTEWMAGSADHFAHYIDDAAEAGRQTGELSHFFDETRQTLETVGSLTGNVASGFWDIGKAAKPLGDEILASLNEQSEDFADWTSSMQGQNELRDYFREAKPGIFEAGRLIKDASRDVVELSKGQGFLTVTRALRTELLPVLNDVVKSTSASFGPVMIEALTEVGKLIGSLAGTSGPLTLFVESVTQMVHVINGAFDAVPGLQAFVVTLAGIATVSKAMRFTGMVSGLTTSLGLSKKLLTNIGLIEAEQAGVAATAARAGTVAVTVPGGGRDLRTPAAAAGEFGEKQAMREAGLIGASGAGMLSSARSMAGRLGSGLMSYGIGGIVVGQVVKEVGNSDLATKVGDAVQGAGVGAAIGSAIAPGIGTAVGAALGGTGGLLLGVIDGHRSDIEKAGAEQAAEFIRGFARERPKLRREIEAGFLGHAGKTTMIPGAPGSGIQFESRTGNTGLRGKRNELQAELTEAKASNNPRAAAAFEKEIELIDRAIAGIQKSRRGFRAAMDRLRSDAVLGMGGVEKALEAGLEQASNAWAHGTPQWRKHTAQAMRAAVIEIRQGMRSGTIAAGEGRKEIESILGHLHLVTGKNPLGLADEITKEFRRTGRITAAGVSDFTRKLQQMPKGAREQARVATKAMLQVWAQGNPKLEAQVDQLTQYMTSKFGQSGKASAEAQRRAMRSIIEQVGGASSSVAAGLTTIGTDLTNALQALGAHDIPEFKVSAEGRAHHMGPEFKAGGGITRVPGVGLEDTVPVRVNGAISAVVAPGEDLMVLNRHQRPKLDRAVANEYGVAGMPGFFAANQRLHYMAAGGIHHPQVAGGGRGLREGAQDSIDDVYKEAVRYWRQHNGIGRVIANGNRMDALHKPYLWGGGHGATASRNGPWDCSGGTSEMAIGSGLKGPDFNFAPMVSGGFGSWGLPGKGDFTVLSNSEHVYSVLNTPKGWRAIGTSDSNPGGGFGWIDDYTFRPGFTIRHADFGASSGSHQGRRDSKGQKKAKGYAGGGILPTFAGGGVITGKVSYFGGGEEASGMNTSQPGIAVNLNPGSESGWNNDKTQGWISAAREGHPVFAAVTIAGHSANLPITDLGPAGFTQRAIDVTEGGVAKLGFSTSNFPTDATGTARILGQGGAAGGKGSRAKGRSTPREKPAVGGGVAVEVPPLADTPLSPSAKHLPKHIRSQMTAPGITRAEKFSLGELALSEAKDTEKIGDDLAALDFLTEMTKSYKRRTLKEIKRVRAQLHKASSPAQRKKLEGQLEALLSGLGEAESNLHTYASERKETKATYREEHKTAAEEKREKEKTKREEAEQKHAEEEESRREYRRGVGDLALANAETTTGKDDDVQALEVLRRIAEEELDEARRAGDPGDIADATRNLTQATENLHDAIVGSFEERTEGELALAELTDGMGDDIAVLTGKLAFAQTELAEAQAQGNWAEIAKWAHEVKGLTDAIKADEGAEASSQLKASVDELIKTLQEQQKLGESILATSGATLMRALADLLGNQLGAKSNRLAQTAGNGSLGTV